MSGAVVIPSHIDNLPVTSVEYGAFGCRENPTLLTIPEGATRIGETAFLAAKNPTIRTPANFTAAKYTQGKRVKFEATSSQ